MKEKQEYLIEIRRTLLPYILLCLASCVGAYLGGKLQVMLGLFEGMVVGVVYFLMMSSRVQKSLELPMQKAVWYMRIGWFIRVAFVLMVFIATLRYSQVDFPALLAGFFLLHFAILVRPLLMVLRLKSNASKGK